MHTRNRSPFLLLAAVSVLLPSSGARGQEQAKTAEQIAAELANPNTALGVLSFNLDFQAFDGTLPDAGDALGFTLAFQPSLPVPLGGGVNFFARPNVPLIFAKDLPTEEGLERRGIALGDIGFDLGVGKTFQSGLILVGGMVGTLPTATDEDLGLDQWLLGPEALVALAGGWGAVGALITHQWDVAGEQSFDTSISAGQYFIVFGLGGGWQIRSAPTFSYNHNGEEGQKLTMPLGAGLMKTSILGTGPWKFGLEYWYYVAQPDAFGPAWQLRFTVSPVVPLPWGG